MQKKFRKAEPGASGKGEELGYPQEVGGGGQRKKKSECNRSMIFL